MSARELPDSPSLTRIKYKTHIAPIPTMREIARKGNEKAQMVRSINKSDPSKAMH
jgi:hypothetical protein